MLTSYKESPGRPSLTATLQALQNCPNIFAVAGMSFLRRANWDLGEIREHLRDGKIKGIKFYCGYEPFYPNEPAMLPVVEIAKEFDVPIFIHNGDTYTPTGKLKYAHPLAVDDFAVDHPELRIIICHLGNPWLRDTMEVVYKNANVYSDISGLVLGGFSDRFEKFMIKQIQEMLTFGMNPSKILYGTDWPISSMGSYLDFVSELTIPTEDRLKILGKNAMRLFKLDPKSSPYHSF